MDALALDTPGPPLPPIEGTGPLDPLHGYAIQLRKRISLTRGARFQATKRHRSRAIASVWSIIFLSMYVFTLSVTNIIFSGQLALEVTEILNFLALILSAFIIAFSVFEQGKQHDLKADHFLHCAQKLGELHDLVDMEISLNKVDEQKLRQFTSDYQRILLSVAEDHLNVDYRTYRYQTRMDKDRGVVYFVVQLRYWMASYGTMATSIAAPPILLVLMLIGRHFLPLV